MATIEKDMNKKVESFKEELQKLKDTEHSSDVDKLLSTIETNFNEYIEDYKKYIKIEEEQNKEYEQKEYMMLGLRKIEGVNIQKFKNKFMENPLYIYKNEIEKLVNEGLLEVYLNYIKLTKKGIDLANLVWEEFV